jgi:type III restriction enzyme
MQRGGKMPRSDKQQFKVNDLVLKVREDCDRSKWNEDKYEAFLELLCGERYYQKEAILESLRYILAGEYKNLKDLAKENWDNNPYIENRYGTWNNFENHLQFPDKLAASIDLATGTGKSYVIYGIAQILLAEGAVDRVLVLCPSTTIETGLYDKFKLLAGNSELAEALPEDAKVRIPKIIQADETITAGCICVENRDAVYAHVKSSIKDSLWGKGVKVAVLNDESHHVANDPAGKTKKWKEFLETPEYGFRIVLGFSGTCYVENNYFSDVIYRYSLRQAIEERFVKKVRYLTDIETTGEENEEWQLRINMHEVKRKELKPRKITPLSIVVTPTIEKCKTVGDELKQYLIEYQGYSEEDADQKVLIIYNNAPDIPKLSHLDEKTNKIEWIISVSMLNEGWDVRRVFQIVPHEEKAFNSKLLIAQVLGRGLRVPPDWKGEQPEVTIFNHAAWAPNIRHLVNEILETEKTLTSKVLLDSPYHFELHNLRYNVVKKTEEKQRKGPFDLLTKGIVDIPTEADSVEINVEFEKALNGDPDNWKTIIKRKKYTPKEVAMQMSNFLEKLDMETSSLEKKQQTSYSKQFPYERLLGIVKKSLRNQDFCTETNKQKLLQALGTMRRMSTKIVRYELDPKMMFIVNTKDKPNESASAAQLKRDKVAYIPSDTADNIDEEQMEFFKEVFEEGGDYKHVNIKNRHDLKTPVSIVFSDSSNEKKFIDHLKDPKIVNHIDAWIKSTSMNFYAIDYAWRKGEHPKRGKFNPDFFIKIGSCIIVVEIKDDEELKLVSSENIKKHEYAAAHFERINVELNKQKSKARYYFHFLTPKDYPDFFNQIKNNGFISYNSKLDVKLRESQNGI